MVEPTLADYVELFFNLFERFWQQHAAPDRRGHPYWYHHKVLIVFFVIMHQRRIFRFKAQHRWLRQHPEWHAPLHFDTVPHRSTLSRRYKALYKVVEQFIAFVGVYAEDLDARFDSKDLDTDKSLFKAHGPVWHQSDRKEGRIPEGVRLILTDFERHESEYPAAVMHCL